MNAKTGEKCTQSRDPCNLILRHFKATFVLFT